MKAVLLGMALIAIVRPENLLPVLAVLGVLAGFVVLAGFSFDAFSAWRPTVRWLAHRNTSHTQQD